MTQADLCKHMTCLPKQSCIPQYREMCRHSPTTPSSVSPTHQQWCSQAGHTRSAPWPELHPWPLQWSWSRLLQHGAAQHSHPHLYHVIVKMNFLSTYSNMNFYFIIVFVILLLYNHTELSSSWCPSLRCIHNQCCSLSSLWRALTMDGYGKNTHMLPCPYINSFVSHYISTPSASLFPLTIVIHTKKYTYSKGLHVTYAGPPTFPMTTGLFFQCQLSYCPTQTG